MTGVQTCALPICFPVTIGSLNTTNNGIYANYRVWTAGVEVTASSTNAADLGYLAIAPLIGTAASYGGSFENVCSAPNSKSRAWDDTTINDASLKCMWSIPALIGIPKSNYSAFTPTVGNFSSPPSTACFAQISLRAGNVGTNWTGFITGNTVSNFTFAVGINTPSLPFNQTGGTASGLPNPAVPLNQLQPAGLKNLLLNSTTNSGIYANYRVWTAGVEVTASSTNAADLGYLAIAPLIGTAASYGGVS